MKERPNAIITRVMDIETDLMQAASDHTSTYAMTTGKNIIRNMTDYTFYFSFCILKYVM